MSRPRAHELSYAKGSDAAGFAEFCREHIIQSVDRWDGEPLQLEPFQRRLMGEALAYDEHGLPIWNSVVIILPRKNGKTALLAAYAIFRLLTSEGTPEILLSASSDKQAGRLFDACASYIRRSETLAALVRVRDHAGELRREDGFGCIYRLSSDPARLHGYNPSEVIVDELHAWTTPSLRRSYAALTSAGGARQSPRTFTITTAGEAHERRTSILGRILDAGLEAEDLTREPGLAICRLWAAKTLVWNYEAPTIDPFDTKAIKQANPASWITPTYLRRQAENPELTDSHFLQLHGCVWAQGETQWLAPADWQMRMNRERKLADGERIVLGFDGSYRRDSTALVACTLDGFITPIKVWERPEHAPPDWKVPRGDVDDEIDDAMERYDVAELACDPPGWHAEFDQWVEKFGAVVVEFPTNQRVRMAPACDRFRTGVMEGGLTHSGNLVLASHISHCVAKETPAGVVVTKEHPDSPRKIDTAVAAIVAYDRAMWWAANSYEAWAGFPEEREEVFA